MAATEAARLLSDLLAVPFGPDGMAVLLHDPTGRLTVTRSGFHLLKTVYPENESPHARVIMNAVESVQEDFGDGVKSFVFAVHGILDGCVGLDGPSRIVRQLVGLQSRLSQLCVTNAPPDTRFSQHVDFSYSSVIKSFFRTRFPLPVSSVLAPLLLKWAIASSPSLDTTGLTNLYQNFQYLCCYQGGASRPVSESCIRNGFVVNGRTLNVTRSGPRQLIILAFHDSDSDSGKFDDLDVKCEVDRLLVQLRSNGASEENKPEILLVTPAILSDLTLFNLRRANVGIVHGVLVDDVNFLLTLISHGTEPNTDCIVDVTFDKDRDEVCVNVGGVCQLLIFGPTRELCTEYAQTCQRALKLMVLTSRPSFRNLVCKCGGTFERNLHGYLVSKFDSRNASVPHFVNRAELLAWHNQKAKVVESNISDDLYSFIGAAFTGLDADVLEAVLQGMLAVPRKLPQVVVSDEASEPVALRIGILMHALGTVATLVKIDTVIFTNRPNVK